MSSGPIATRQFFHRFFGGHQFAAHELAYMPQARGV
jgi:hypothetical protein